MYILIKWLWIYIVCKGRGCREQQIRVKELSAGRPHERIIWGASSKVTLKHVQIALIQIKVSSRPLFSIHTFYSIEWFSKRTVIAWSDCVDAKADLGLHCLHMPEDKFLHAMTHLMMLIGWRFFFCCFLLLITKTYLYNFDPLKPHFYIVKLGFTWVYIIFLISAQKHRRLWVLARTTSVRWF